MFPLLRAREVQPFIKIAQLSIFDKSPRSYARATCNCTRQPSHPHTEPRTLPPTRFNRPSRLQNSRSAGNALIGVLERPGRMQPDGRVNEIRRPPSVVVDEIRRLSPHTCPTKFVESSGTSASRRISSPGTFSGTIRGEKSAAGRSPPRSPGGSWPRLTAGWRNRPGSDTWVDNPATLSLPGMNT